MIQRHPRTQCPGPVDRNHRVFSGQEVTERLVHHFKVRTDHIQPRAGEFDQQTVLSITALQDPHAGLREQRQGEQRPHENN